MSVEEVGWCIEGEECVGVWKRGGGECGSVGRLGRSVEELGGVHSSVRSVGEVWVGRKELGEI